MLVSELRELIKKYKEEDLRLLISEMYKAMPKKLREDKDIDALVNDVHAYLNTGKAIRKQCTQKDINNLKAEIEQFIDYAYKQYYFAPNSIVHKKERPKWRFKVKAYIKDLQCFPVEGEEGITATNLLEKLYEMLSYGCGYYIFNTDNPFWSVGIAQTELLDIVIKRKLGNGISQETIKASIDLVINSILDTNTLYSSLMLVLISNLKTPDSKELAIEQCKALKAELDRPKASKKSRFSDSSDYIRTEKVNNIAEMVFRLYVSLSEYEKAIKYYCDSNVEWDKEISLYVLLSLLREYELKEYWLREYDEAVKKGVNPRTALQNTYKYIRENDKLPD